MSHETLIIGALWIGTFSLAFGIYIGCKFTAVDNSLIEIENNALRGTNRRAMNALRLANQRQAETQAQLEKVLETRQNLRNWN